MGEIKKYFLDTNIIIYYLQGNNKVKKFFNEIEHGLAVGYFSFITKIELYSFPDIQKNKRFRFLPYDTFFDLYTLLLHGQPLTKVKVLGL